MLLGFHVSIAGTIDKAVDRAKDMSCTTFQIFTRNPRGWAYEDLDNKEVEAFVKKCREKGYTQPAAHMPYLPNLASPKDDVYIRSIASLEAELKRCGALHIPYLVTHLGSHLGRGEKFGINRIIDSCNTALSKVNNDVSILLENTAGTKNSVGSTFENIRYILDNVSSDQRIGVCFDTAHAFAAGYDLRRQQDVNLTLGLLKEIVGYDKVKMVHLNDSKSEFNSHSDRHDHIGLGYIGEKGFRSFLNHSFAQTRPLVMETPVDLRRDDWGNMEKVKELAGKY
jgi:deoxyribonuclease-4